MYWLTRLKARLLTPLRAFYVLGFRLALDRRGISVASTIGLAVGVMMLGILLPIGLSAWEAYTPTNATLLVIWPIGAVLIVLGIVLGFFSSTR